MEMSNIKKVTINLQIWLVISIVFVSYYSLKIAMSDIFVQHMA